MPGLVNDFMQLPPDQKQKLIAYAGQALGARGGDINNVMAKLQANPAMAMQFMERSGIGVANPIRGQSGDRAWEPDFASTVSRSMQDTPSSSDVRQAQPKQARTQTTAPNSGGSAPQPPRRQFPNARDESVGPPPRPAGIGGNDPALARAGDADMGMGGLAAAGAGMVGAGMLARALRGRGGAEPPVRSGLPATTRGNLPELVTMDELMGAPGAAAAAREIPRDRISGPQETEQKRLTDQKTKDPEGYRKSQVPAQDASQGEEPSAPYRTQGKVTDQRGMYNPDDPRNVSAERDMYNRQSEAEAGPAPVDKGNAPPGREASDLATYDDVVSNKGDVTTTKPRYDPEGYRQSQVPDDQQEYRTEPEKPKQIEGPKKNKAARTRVRIKGTNVRFK